MITSALLYLVYYLGWLFTLPLRATSDVAVNGNVITSLAQMVSWLGENKHIIPLAAITGAFVIVLVVEAGIAGYKLTMWAIRRVWGS